MQGVVSQSYKYNEKISPELYVLNFVVRGIDIHLRITMRMKSVHIKK